MKIQKMVFASLLVAIGTMVGHVIYIPVAILGIALILIGFFKDKFKQENFDL